MTNQIQCPNCGSYRTSPHSENSGDYLTEAMRGFLSGLFSWSSDDNTFAKPENVKKFRSGKIGAICADCQFKFDINTNPRRASMNSHKLSTNPDAGNIEERLSQLEQLRKKNLITEDEYKHKREELLKSL